MDREEVNDMAGERPIDKKKKSNHRCINCDQWDKCVPNPDYPRRDCDHEYICPKAGDKPVTYWNRCPLFNWNPGKDYLPD